MSWFAYNLIQIARKPLQKKDLLAEAEGRQALANSENTRSPEIIAMRVAPAMIEVMPRIIQEMGKPAEKIEYIRINQIPGLTGANLTGAKFEVGGPKPQSPVHQAFDAMLRAILQLLVMQKLGEELGLNFTNGLTGLLNDPKPRNTQVGR